MRRLAASLGIALVVASSSIAATTPPAARHILLGSSVLGAPIEAVELGNPNAAAKVVVVGCIHGNECAGVAIVHTLERLRVPPGVDLWLVVNANPDGDAAGTRDNAHGVDLNRNFPWRWKPSQQVNNSEYSGPYPISEAESRILYTLLTTLSPRLVIWYHQPLAVVDKSGGDLTLERLYSHLVGLPLKRLPRYPGSATSWADHRFKGATSFVVELPKGPLTHAAARRHALAVLALAHAVASAS